MFSALKPDQVQYGIMRLTFGEGRFRRSHWVFVCWSPDSMTKVDSQKLKKKRMNERMVNIGYKGKMQKLIGPYGVEVLAESYEYVTLEDWILRVRRTVVVDGDDELMNAEAFKIALEAEKAHFAEKKRKQEEERRKKEELERKLKAASESSSEEDLYDKDEAAKNKKKRKRKKKKDADDDDSGDKEGEDEDKETEIKEEEVTVDKPKDDFEENKEDDKDEVPPLNLDTEAAAQTTKRVKSPRRRGSASPEVLKARDVSSQLCYESITLIKRPDSDLVWVLIEPRLRK